MWSDYIEAPNLMIAQMWRDVLDGEGLPTCIIPKGELTDWSEHKPFRVLVPVGRRHVADEIIRKL